MPLIRQSCVVIFKLGDNVVVHSSIKRTSTSQGLNYVSGCCFVSRISCRSYGTQRLKVTLGNLHLSSDSTGYTNVDPQHVRLKILEVTNHTVVRFNLD